MILTVGVVWLTGCQLWRILWLSCKKALQLWKNKAEEAKRTRILFDCMPGLSLLNMMRAMLGVVLKVDA